MWHVIGEASSALHPEGACGASIAHNPVDQRMVLGRLIHGLKKETAEAVICGDCLKAVGYGTAAAAAADEKRDKQTRGVGKGRAGKGVGQLGDF